MPVVDREKNLAASFHWLTSRGTATIAPPETRSRASRSPIEPVAASSHQDGGRRGFVAKGAAQP